MHPLYVNGTHTSRENQLVSKNVSDYMCSFDPCQWLAHAHAWITDRQIVLILQKSTCQKKTILHFFWITSLLWNLYYHFFFFFIIIMNFISNDMSLRSSRIYFVFYSGNDRLSYTYCRRQAGKMRLFQWNRFPKVLVFGMS